MINKAPTPDDKLIHNISKKIIENFNPEKIILFGSYAGGKQSEESDIDLLVIMNSNKRPARRSIEISKVCRPKFVSMDILVGTPEEIMKRLAIGDYFIRDILEKGKILYDRKAG